MSAGPPLTEGIELRILFVCLGNICRSPAAEGVARDLAREAGLDWQFDSCGTGRWHIGEPPYGPMQAAAGQRGIDLSDLRARQLQRADFGRFDLIVPLDRDNMRDVQAMQPAGDDTPVRLLMEFAPELGVQDVPDPYYTRDFDGALDLIRAGCAALIAAHR